MIFVTLGTQLPFDRLLWTLDEAAIDIDEKIFAQIGASNYVPRHFEAVDFLSPSEFHDKLEAARLIVGHAGIGTILSGKKAGKPLVVMARRAEHGEHRNDHQLATVNQIRNVRGVYVAENSEEMHAYLVDPDIVAMDPSESPARARLIGFLKHEIYGSGL